MGHSNGKITTPVNTADVRLTLGINTDVINQQNISKYVNKWAKYKPVEYSIYDSVNTSVAWWRGTDFRCGLSFTIYQSAKNLISNFGKNWERVSPTTHMRIGDFHRYNHYAKCFVGQFSVIDGIMTMDGQWASIPTISLTLIEDADSLKLSDISSNKTNGAAENCLDRWFFAVVLKSKSNGNVRLVSTFANFYTSLEGFGKTRREITIDAIRTEGTEYSVYPCLCDTDQLIDTGETSGDITAYRLIPLPTDIKEFSIQKTQLMYIFTGTLKSFNTRNEGLSYQDYIGSFNLSIQNKSANSITVDKGTVYYEIKRTYYDDKGIPVTVTTGKQTFMSSNVTIAKNGTYSLPSDYAFQFDAYINGYKIAYASIEISWLQATDMLYTSGAIGLNV